MAALAAGCLPGSAGASDPMISPDLRRRALARLAQPPRAIEGAHLALIRRLHFNWIAAENLAPAVDAVEPLGKPGTLRLARDFIGAGSEADAALHLVDLATLLPKFIAAASLAPGAYSVSTRTPVDPTEARVEPDGTFRLGAENVILLKALVTHDVTAEVLDEALGDGLWPIWSVAPKRPFGERTVYEEDMAAILGLARPGPGGIVAIAAEQTARLRGLYAQLRVTASAFCRHATLPDVPFRL